MLVMPRVAQKQLILLNLSQQTANGSVSYSGGQCARSPWHQCSLPPETLPYHCPLRHCRRPRRRRHCRHYRPRPDQRRPPLPRRLPSLPLGSSSAQRVSCLEILRCAFGRAVLSVRATETKPGAHAVCILPGRSQAAGASLPPQHQHNINETVLLITAIH